MTGIGANVGTIVDRVVKNEGAVLAQTMRLVGFKVVNAPKGRLTMRADNPDMQPFGYILIGPAKGDDLNLARIKPYDWGMFTVGLNLRDDPTDCRRAKPLNGISRAPSIVIATRQRFKCDEPTCNHTDWQWKMTLERWARDMRTSALEKLGNAATQEQKSQACRDVRDKIFCPRSLKVKKVHTATIGAFIKRRLTAVDGDKRNEAVFENYDAPELTEFAAAAASDRRLVLPRIWALYNERRMPEAIAGWKPEDEIAEGLAEALHKRSLEAPPAHRVNYALRPYALAAKVENFKNGLLGFLTDLPADGDMTVGWIPESELIENKALGYKVTLMAERPQEFTI